ncbi:LamG-like jellyroll fold domain-containing protein [Aestuariibaculum marinum]|uniref:LamG domain-containing protein n=1 Tax=Aestuariibaculum marinum TaxID=2683592 RepID=A0A8J6PV41_9FLAO|nr:LamG-like jellyroll fold domain-containing protein [Aestuariibaculum marinum]MBD0823748.1 hypothetical protein [Aestuariibaculum marinum]
MKKIVLRFLIFLMFNFCYCQVTTNWELSSLLKEDFNGIIDGHPIVVSSSIGEVLSFNGINDALFLNQMPLKDLETFTVEMIFKPATDGSFEQRVLHIGEVSRDRMLLEIRVLNGYWYFDGFVKSGEHKKALIDESLMHKSGVWHHVALVVEKHKLTTYVNGVRELQEPFEFRPIQTGKTSIGVRLNKRSWFKGDIYKIRITPNAITPIDFMSL